VGIRLVPSMKRTVIASTILIAILAIWWFLYGSREARSARAYEHAVLGQSEAEIVHMIGEPDEVLPCGEFLWWDGDRADPPRNDGRCQKWVRYNFFLHAFAFGYSADGHLVSRYEYFSE